MSAMTARAHCAAPHPYPEKGNGPSITAGRQPWEVYFRGWGSTGSLLSLPQTRDNWKTDVVRRRLAVTRAREIPRCRLVYLKHSARIGGISK